MRKRRANPNEDETRTIYLHYEAAGAEFSTKHAWHCAQPPVLTVGELKAQFVASYNAAGPGGKVQHGGAALDTARLVVTDIAGDQVWENLTLSETFASGEDVVFADAAAGGSSASASGASAPCEGKLFASQAAAGENSYYYAHSRETGEAKAPKAAPARLWISSSEETVEESLHDYSFLDDGMKVKVYIPFPGIGDVSGDAVQCAFRERSFDLRVRVADSDAPGGQPAKVLRLHVPVLQEKVDPGRCLLKKRTDKLQLVLRKLESGSWYEVRNTKGIGDKETYVPDYGDAVIKSLA